VGTNNLLAGEVRERRGERVFVETGVGRLEAIPNAATITDRCVLAIRPENVAIAQGGAVPAAGPGGGNRVSGRVSFTSYLGNTLRYDVEASGGVVLKADIRDPWHHDPMPLGQAVTVSFPASVTLALPEEP
jgi:ABC-type Fe3+/spermidine/putrescine transport system ATPase subunit